MADLPPLASAVQLKKQLKQTTNTHDSEIDLYLQAASNVARNILSAGGMVLDPAIDPPADAVLATLFIAQHLWESQHQAPARPSTPGDGGGGGDVVNLRGFSIPRRAAELLTTMLSGRGLHGPRFSFPAPQPWPGGV